MLAGIDFGRAALHAGETFAAPDLGSDEDTMYAENVLRAGDRLDRYELLCPIASGGMATVWLARLRGKHGFQKLFAVKTIRAELLDDPEVQSQFQEMFLDEARIASGIQHPNVAQILDLGEEHDVYFIVMEWVDGDSLAKIRKLAARKGRAVPIGPALRIVDDACAGLHAAHELRDERGDSLGIVHRDVSPQNILVTTGGAVKVIDFGIAKSQNRQQGETRTGIMKGKLQYMAPEQVKKARIVDRRADVWALGVCLHELVAGRLPNDSDDDVEVIRKLLANEAPQIAAGLPPPVARVIARSVALDPEDRFPTAGAMQRAIEDAMKELGAAATGEDVATFLHGALPELAEKRRWFVSQAVGLERARRVPAREHGGPPGGGAPESDGEPEGDGPEEVAFAPTMISDASSASSRRRSGEVGGAGATAGTEGNAGTAGSRDRRPHANEFSDRQADEDSGPLRIPKTRPFGGWLAAAVLAAFAVAALRWLPAYTGRLTSARASGSAKAASNPPERDPVVDGIDLSTPGRWNDAPEGVRGAVRSGERASRPRPLPLGATMRPAGEPADSRGLASSPPTIPGAIAVRPTSLSIESLDAFVPSLLDGGASPDGSLSSPASLPNAVEAGAFAPTAQNESFDRYEVSGDAAPIPGSVAVAPSEAGDRSAIEE